MRRNFFEMELAAVLGQKFINWINPRITYKVCGHLKYPAGNDRESIINVHYVLLFAHISEHLRLLAINV